MENASKALIIAGAILLSILIIALGMRIYNSASSSVGSADLSAQEVNAHNSQFTSYEGKQSGTQIKSLINAIKTNNSVNKDRMVKITFNNNATKSGNSVSVANVAETNDVNSDYATLLANAKNTTTYFVTFAYMDNGCIGGVEIHIYSSADL